MKKISDVNGIRNAIMAMDKPFCLIDLYLRLEKRGITDRDLILYVLAKLYEEGLIEYGKVDDVIGGLHSRSNWAFYIA